MSDLDINSANSSAQPTVSPQSGNTNKFANNFEGHSLKTNNSFIEKIESKLSDIKSNLLTNSGILAIHISSKLKGRVSSTFNKVSSNSVKFAKIFSQKLSPTLPKLVNRTPASFSDSVNHLGNMIAKTENSPEEAKTLTHIAGIITKDSFITKLNTNIQTLDQKLKEIQSDLEKSSGKLTPEIKEKIAAYMQLADKVTRFNNFIMRNIMNGIAMGTVKLPPEQSVKFDELGTSGKKLNDQLNNLTSLLNEHMQPSHIRALLDTPEIKNSTVLDSLQGMLKQQGVTIYDYNIERSISNAETNVSNISKDVSAGTIFSPERFDTAIKEEKKIQDRLIEQISLNQEFPKAESESEIARDTKLLNDSKARQKAIGEMKENYRPDLTKWPAADSLDGQNVSVYTAMLYQIDQDAAFLGHLNKHELSNYMTTLVVTAIRSCAEDTNAMTAQKEGGGKIDSYLSARYRDVHTTVGLLLAKADVKEALGDETVKAMENLLAALETNVNTMANIR